MVIMLKSYNILHNKYKVMLFYLVVKENIKHYNNLKIYYLIKFNLLPKENFWP